MKIRSELPCLDGATKWLNHTNVTTEDLKDGKPVIIHFWSVSCKQCKTVIKNINRLRDDYKGKVHVIAVHMPRTEKDFNIEDVKIVAQTYDIIQPIYVDNDYVLTDLFGNELVPSCYLFDKMGKLRHYQIGARGMKILQNRLIRMID